MYIGKIDSMIDDGLRVELVQFAGSKRIIISNSETNEDLLWLEENEIKPMINLLVKACENLYNKRSK